MLRLAIFLAALILLPGHSYSNPKESTEGKPITILAELTGTDSTNFKSEHIRCSDDWQGWQEIWRTHRSKQSPIEINQMLKFDMKSNMALAIFQGDCGYHGSVWFISIEEFPDHIRVSYVVESVQHFLYDKRESVRPIRFEGGSYGFAVIPKSNKQIRFELGFKHLVDEPYTWNEVAILPAIRK